MRRHAFVPFANIGERAPRIRHNGSEDLNVILSELIPATRSPPKLRGHIKMQETARISIGGWLTQRYKSCRRDTPREPWGPTQRRDLRRWRPFQRWVVVHALRDEEQWSELRTLGLVTAARARWIQRSWGDRYFHVDMYVHVGGF